MCDPLDGVSALCRPLSDVKRKALKQSTLSFAKKPKSAHAPAAAEPDQEAIVISEEEEILIDV